MASVRSLLLTTRVCWMPLITSPSLETRMALTLSRMKSSFWASSSRNITTGVSAAMGPACSTMPLTRKGMGMGPM